MKAIILAAGRGTRLKDLTKDTPKILVPVGGRPIIEYTLDALPQKIDEVIFVVSYYQDKIRAYLGQNYRGYKIHYVEQRELNGTGGAILSCRSLIADGESFLVLNGDDIYDRDEISAFLNYEHVFGYSRCLPPSTGYLSLNINELKVVDGFKKITVDDLNVPANIVTGAYLLTSDIFKYEPVRLANGEIGLPQMLLKNLNTYPMHGVYMQKWLSMNTQEDILHAQKYFESNLKR